MNRWRDADEAFAGDIEEAAASFIQANVEAIQAEPDWKAKAWLLKSSPVSKGQWGEQKSQGGTQVNIMLGISRDDGITLENDAPSIQTSTLRPL